MPTFNEHSLEMSIMELFQDEGYLYLNGKQIHRERSEVLLADDLRQYLLNRYAKDGLTATEVDGILLRLKSISGTIYEANKAFCKLLCDGFIFNVPKRICTSSWWTMIIPKTTSSKSSTSLRLRGLAVSFVSRTA